MADSDLKLFGLPILAYMFPHFIPSFECATVLAIIVREIGSGKVLNWKGLMKCGFVEAPYFAHRGFNPAFPQTL